MVISSTFQFEKVESMLIKNFQILVELDILTSGYLDVSFDQSSTDFSLIFIDKKTVFKAAEKKTAQKWTEAAAKNWFQHLYQSCIESFQSSHFNFWFEN